MAVVAISLSLVGNSPFAGSDDEVAFTVAATTAPATTVVAAAEAAPTTAAAAQASTTTAITAAPTTTTPDREALEAAAAMVEAAQAAAEPETSPEHDSDLAASEASPAFDVSTDRPDEMALSLETISAGSGDPFPVIEVAAEEGLECRQTLVDETEPGSVVLVLARGLVDGAEAELYVIRSSDPDHDPIVAIFILPDCSPLDIQ